MRLKSRATIKEEAPNAQIITVGDFWADDTKDAVKKSAAEEAGITYVDLSEIQDNPNYEQVWVRLSKVMMVKSMR